jgi:D-3-phosphoglycerate dehydrogenase
MRVLIPEPIAQSGKNYLNERGYELIDCLIDTKDKFIKNIQNCDGLLVRTIKCDKNIISTAKNLKVISKHGVGVDNIDIDYCTQKKIQVTFTPNSVCNAVAEHVVLLLLVCAKHSMLTIRHFVDKGDFKIRHQVEKMGVEITGKTIGILGLGRIGCLVAQKCMSLGMKVIGYDPYIIQGQLGNEIQLMSRDDLLRQADFVSMNLPCTDETRGAFGEREFSLMKKTACFINASRGGVVREEALIKALNEKTIMGAGLDVFDAEPPLADNPLLHMENVFATPHCAGSTIESQTAASLHAAIGIDEVLSGKNVSWPVNKI